MVWRALWFVEPSILTLCCIATRFMISPRVVGLLSLPAVERSGKGMVNESENCACLDAVAMMRGALHAETGALLPAGADGASDGKAMGESVSISRPLAGAAGRTLTGDSTRLGKGSGAPSNSACFLCDRLACECHGERINSVLAYLEVGSRHGYGLYGGPVTGKPGQRERTLSPTKSVKKARARMRVSGSPGCYVGNPPPDPVGTTFLSRVSRNGMQCRLARTWRWRILPDSTCIAARSVLVSIR